MAVRSITTRDSLSIRDTFPHPIAALIETRIVKTAEHARFLLGFANFNKTGTGTPSSAMPRKRQSLSTPGLIETKNAKTAEQTRFLLDPADFNKAAFLKNQQPTALGQSIKQKLQKPWNKAVFIEY